MENQNSITPGDNPVLLGNSPPPRAGTTDSGACHSPSQLVKVGKGFDQTGVQKDAASYTDVCAQRPHNDIKDSSAEFEITITKKADESTNTLYQGIVQYVGKSIDEAKVDLVEIPPAVLNAAAKFCSLLDMADLPFQQHRGAQPNESTRASVMRRAIEIIKLQDVCISLQSDLSLHKATDNSRDINTRLLLKYKGWSSMDEMNSGLRNTQKPPTQSLTSLMNIPGKLLQHKYPKYTPTNKEAKTHLRAIRDLGYEDFPELPINFSYYEPSLTDESKGSKMGRRQIECNRMNNRLANAAKKKKEAVDNRQTVNKPSTTEETHKELIEETTTLRNKLTSYVKKYKAVEEEKAGMLEKMTLSLIHISEPTRPY